MFRISKKKIPEFLKAARVKFEVIAPVRENGASFFKIISETDKVYLGSGNTDYSPKRFFFPETEHMFAYGMEGKVAPAEQIKKRLLFGIRPCDVAGLQTIDKLFEGEPADPYYVDKRRNTLLAVLECATPGKNCFCDSMETRDAKEYDLLFREHGEYYYVDAKTEAGKALITPLFENADSEPQFKREKCKKKLEIVAEKKMTFAKWGARCFTCGSCTSVCPTCTCFDAEDLLDFAGGVRRGRRWASCFTRSYSEVSGGHVFRQPVPERLKQFVLHKLKYHKEKYGPQMCVGCGRCISVCLAGIDITKVSSGK